MDKLTEQLLRVKIEEAKEKLEEKRQRLDEMAVHCDVTDHNGMYIIVGGTPFWEKRKRGSESQKEHNPPHAHIRWKSKGKYLCSRFQIVSMDPPKTIEDLKTVNESDIPLDSISETLIKWANEEPKRYKEDTNWEAMRSSWIQIQSYVNEGQKHPVVLQTKEEYEKEKKNKKYAKG